MTANYKKRIFVQIQNDEAFAIITEIKDVLAYCQNEHPKLEELWHLIDEQL